MPIKLRITDNATDEETFVVFAGVLEEYCANILASRYGAGFYVLEVEVAEDVFIPYEDFIYEGSL